MDKPTITKHERKTQIRDALHDASRLLAEAWGPMVVVERNAMILATLMEACANVDTL